jgi:hypothetical protein
MPLANTKTVNFDRKPSKASIIKTIKTALKSGYYNIEIVWGENMIEIKRLSYNSFTGYGWIGKNSGSDIADNLHTILKTSV